MIGTLNLCDVAYTRNLHVTNFATGCIFEYDAKHPLGSGIGFTEDDEPNFKQSFYSKTKGITEGLLREYPNVLTLRVRMPISDDLSPRSFIAKISKYAKVVDVPKSMTVLHDLLPLAIDMAAFIYLLAVLFLCLIIISYFTSLQNLFIYFFLHRIPQNSQRFILMSLTSRAPSLAYSNEWPLIWELPPLLRSNVRA